MTGSARPAALAPHAWHCPLFAAQLPIPRQHNTQAFHSPATTALSTPLAAAHHAACAQVWDLGGQTSIRPYWRCYYPNTQAIIYVVDSSDTERIGISKEEFHAILHEDELKDALILVYANKQVRGCRFGCRCGCGTKLALLVYGAGACQAIPAASAAGDG